MLVFFYALFSMLASGYVFLLRLMFLLTRLCF